MMLYIIFRTPQQVKREVLSTDLIIPGELLEIFFFRTFEFFKKKHGCKDTGIGLYRGRSMCQ